jgi:hypothetical protein
MATTRQNAQGVPAPAIESIRVRSPAAIAMTGFSRSRINELIGTGELRIAKEGRTTLIIVASLREAIDRRIVMREIGDF